MTVDEIRAEIASRQGGDYPILGLVNNINHVVDRIRDKGAWSFFHAIGVLNLEAEYTTGTVTVTNGSTTLTGSGTTFTPSHVGWKFRGNKGEEYTIAAYVSATELTLDAAWVGDTDSGVSYSLYKDTYLLPANFDRMGRMWDQTHERELYPVTKLDTHAYAAYFAQPQIETLAYSVFGYKSDLTQRQVVFSPAPKEAARVVYTYYKKPIDVSGPSSSPDLPADMHRIVLQGALARTIKQNTKNNPDLWERYREEYAEFQGMLKERWAQDGAMRHYCVRVGQCPQPWTMLRSETILEMAGSGYLLTELGGVMFGNSTANALLVE